MKLEHIHNIYFVGIGGIGMSALAKYFMSCGKTVAGYDRTPSAVTLELESMGITIDYQNTHNYGYQNADLVVFTPAVSQDSPIRKQLRNTNIPQLKRAAVLGMITENKNTLAVAGTHGKTTTAAILTQLIHTVYGSVTGFIGGKSANFNNNFIYNEKAEFTVVEADEYDRSFLQLKPNHAIITSVDADHLDIYKTAAEMRRGFHEFADLVSDHLLISDEAAATLQLPNKHFTYGFGPTADYKIDSLRIVEGKNVFNLHTPQGIIKNLTSSLAGKHNVENAAAAVALCHIINPEHITAVKEGLAKFRGVQRRFELIIKGEKGIYIDDYAHHPKELEAAISAAKMMYPKKQITVVFQPHLFSRTADFMDEFATVLATTDKTYMLDIYPAREKPIHGVSSSVLTKKINNIASGKAVLVTMEELIPILQKNTPPLLLTLGAGNIADLREPIKKEVYS